MTSEAISPRPSPWTRWLIATRPPTLPAAIAPVLVGAAAAGADDHFRPLVFAATLAAAILLQIGANFSNDLFDFERGADTAERLGPPRVTQTGLMSPEEVRIGTVASFVAAAALGVYLFVVGGWPILGVGVLSIIAGLAYTGGPWPFGYHGLGDLMVFIFFGLIAVIGTYYLQADGVNATPVLAAIPVGMTVTAILVVNNLRDIETDKAAGKHTLAVFIGERATRAQYALFVLGPFAFLFALLAESSAWVLLSFGALPIALMLCMQVLSGTRGRGLNPVLKRTAQLHMAFGALLALGLLL